MYPDFGIETRYVNKILKEMATIYAILIKQYKFINHVIFSASVYKIKKEDQRSDEIESFIILNNNHNLLETDINNIDVKTELGHQFQFRNQRIMDGFLIKNISTKKLVN